MLICIKTGLLFPYFPFSPVQKYVVRGSGSFIGIRDIRRCDDLISMVNGSHPQPFPQLRAVCPVVHSIISGTWPIRVQGVHVSIFMLFS